MVKVNFRLKNYPRVFHRYKINFHDTRKTCYNLYQIFLFIPLTSSAMLNFDSTNWLTFDEKRVLSHKANFHDIIQ